MSPLIDLLGLLNNKTAVAVQIVMLDTTESDNTRPSKQRQRMCDPKLIDHDPIIAAILNCEPFFVSRDSQDEHKVGTSFFLMQTRVFDQSAMR
uniref:PINc domain-containing protein n=1 Tax=Steinernema glaseri TaxID=37863 RepID=A0A1I7YTW4_9BILA